VNGPRTVTLVGDPVGRSVSPAMQNAAFAAAGVDVRYEAVRVTREALPIAFEALARSCLGLNVTTPLKEAILPLLDEIDGEAARAGSVNTVRFDEGDRAIGSSTDGAGLLAALRGAEESATAARAGVALILGTGGAARAVAASLADEGFKVAVAGRNELTGRRLVAGLEAAGRSRIGFISSGTLTNVPEGTSLVVNATPLGGEAFPDRDPLPDAVDLPPGLTVVDLVYGPRRTRLLRRAAAAGCRAVEGIEMLIEQGARSFEVWTGISAPLEVMRTAAYAALDARTSDAGTAAVAGGGR
jgi:shikimate dehydrogenase